MKAFNFNQWSQTHLATIEMALDDAVPAYAPAGLGDAMRYAVLDGGKRLRPLLVLASMEASAAGQQVAWMEDAAMRSACAGSTTSSPAQMRWWPVIPTCGEADSRQGFPN